MSEPATAGGYVLSREEERGSDAEFTGSCTKDLA